MPPSEEEQPLLYPQSQTVPEYGHTRLDLQPGDLEAREKLEKRLLRKLDARMSILLILLIFAHIDRTSIAAARLRGFEEDLGLQGSQFASIFSVFFVGYVLMQIPSNIFFSGVGRPSIYLPSCTAIWGIIVICTGFITCYRDALIAWFLLGSTEAAFFPGALFLIAKWYKRNELSQRTAILTCGVALSSAFGSLIASGILYLTDGVLGYPAWRWLLFIEGALTVLVALFSHFILPDFPESKANWLTPAEHALAQLRVIEDAATSPNSKRAAGPEASNNGGTITLFFSTFMDWKVWWLAILSALGMTSRSFNLYFPTLCATMGYSPTITLLLCAPPWIVSAAFMLWVCRRSDRVGDRCMHTVIPLCIGIGGFAMALSTMNIYIRYLSLFLMASSSAGITGCFAWASSSVSHPAAKRAVALAVISATSQIGNIVGSYAWPQSWGPTYNNSFVVCIATSLGCIVMLLFFKKALVQLNKEMDAREGFQGDGTQTLGPGKGWRYQT